jgi:hypothetical protein
MYFCLLYINFFRQCIFELEIDSVKLCEIQTLYLPSREMKLNPHQFQVESLKFKVQNLTTLKGT